MKMQFILKGKILKEHVIDATNAIDAQKANDPIAHQY